MIGNVEAFEFGLLRRPEADDEVDEQMCIRDRPMLIKLASVRDSASLEQAVCQAQDAGRKYIYVASKFLGGK